MTETWSQWVRRMIEAHHDSYMLIVMGGMGLAFTLHVVHHNMDKELLSFGREITIGALSCLYGFLRGVKNSQSALIGLDISKDPKLP